MNPEQIEFDVLVAGAGLVGATTAALLAGGQATRSLRIGLLEARPFAGIPADGDFDPRVVALTEASRNILEDVGAWAAITRARFCPYERMLVRDSEGTGSVEFDCAENHRSNLGHIVENSIVLNALLERIAAFPNVKLVCPAAISSVAPGNNGDGDTGFGRVEVRLQDGVQLSTRLLVAADGGNSKIRDQCGFRLRSWDYGHSAIVATIRTEQPHGYTARQWFMPAGPLAFLPLRSADGDCHHVSIVWSQQHAEANRLQALDDTQFCHALTRASEGSLGTVMAVARRYQFPLQQRHAIDYVQPGIALVGDAAHTIHPLAGQGVNLGLQDAKTLADELERGVGRSLPVGHPASLRRYQRRRKPENLAMMAAMESFKAVFGEQLPAVTLVRNAALRRVDRMAAVKRLLVRKAMGI